MINEHPTSCTVVTSTIFSQRNIIWVSSLKETYGHKSNIKVIPISEGYIGSIKLVGGIIIIILYELNCC